VFEEAMRRAGLSYNIVGGFSFYERMEVRDIIAYLKLALNPNDSIALQRVINTPPRGIGKVTLDEIEIRAREAGISYWEAISQLLSDGDRLSPRAITSLTNFQRIVQELGAKAKAFGATAEEGSEIESTSPVSDLVKAAIIETGYENALKSEDNEEAEARLENLQELVNAAVDYDEQGPDGIREFIDHSALVADTDQYKADVPVTLEPSQFLNEMPLELIEDLSHGRSWLSFARGSSAVDDGQLASHRENKARVRYEGKTYDNAQSISQFFKDRAARMGNPQSSRPSASASQQTQQKHQTGPAADALPGSYVRHAKYGRGLVLRREGSGDQTKLTVSFPGYGQKKLVEKYAGLEKA
jgi:DNA helicase-2/ATP-dependent DNA helicase PcrA